MSDDVSFSERSWFTSVQMSPSSHGMLIGNSTLLPHSASAPLNKTTHENKMKLRLSSFRSNLHNSSGSQGPMLARQTVVFGMYASEGHCALVPLHLRS
jgi:hypothetical protein